MPLTQKLEQKFLEALYKRYSSNYGYGVRNLKECKFYFTAGESFEAEIPEIAVIDGNRKKYLVADWAHELQAKELVKIEPNKLEFFLTEKGYNQASLGWFGKTMAYLNNNQGFSIPLSILSLVVSVIALFVK